VPSTINKADRKPVSGIHVQVEFVSFIHLLFGKYAGIDTFVE